MKKATKWLEDAIEHSPQAAGETKRQ